MVTIGAFGIVMAGILIAHSVMRRRRFASEIKNLEVDVSAPTEWRAMDDLGATAQVAKWSQQRAVAEEGKEAWRKWRTSHYLPVANVVGPVQPHGESSSAAAPRTMGVPVNDESVKGGQIGFHLPRHSVRGLRIHTGTSKSNSDGVQRARSVVGVANM
jgi:hypothetical protein